MRNRRTKLRAGFWNGRIGSHMKSLRPSLIRSELGITGRHGYFDHPVTNAYTESLSNLIHVMNRRGRGYSFEALRAKILFAEGAHKHKNSRPKFERRAKERIEAVREYGIFEDSLTGALGRSIPKPRPVPSPPEFEPPKNYGVDISTLTRMLENDSITSIQIPLIRGALSPACHAPRQTR